MMAGPRVTPRRLATATVGMIDPVLELRCPMRRTSAAADRFSAKGRELPILIGFSRKDQISAGGGEDGDGIALLASLIDRDEGKLEECDLLRLEQNTLAIGQRDHR